MADDQLDIPDQPMTPNERAIISQNADWARTFAPSATNIAQRKRYQEALDTERQTQVGENEQAFQSRLATDKGFRDLYFKDQNARMQQARIAHDMDLSQRKFEMEQQLFPQKMENERLKQNLQGLQMERNLRKEALDAKLAAKTEDQTAAFESDLDNLINVQNATPHSQKFVEGLAKAYAKNPFADKDVVKQWFAQSKINISPEDFQNQVEHLKKIGVNTNNVTATLGPSGWSITAKSPSPEQGIQSRFDQRTLNYLQKERSDPKNQSDPEYQKYLSEQIQALQSKAPASSTASPVSTSTPSQSSAPPQFGGAPSLLTDPNGFASLDRPESAQASPTPSIQPKNLDRDTAVKILAEAGGDKEKARKLARDRGFVFGQQQ